MKRFILGAAIALATAGFVHACVFRAKSGSDFI